MNDIHRLAQEQFEYDAKTGRIQSKLAACGPYSNGKGRLIVRFQKKTVSAHRVAWLIHYGEWPAGMLDHINGDSLDNRIENLRLASYQQNNANRRGWSQSGLKGASYANGKWRSQIMVNGKNIHLGYFKSPEEANHAYKAAAEHYFTEYARAA